MISNAISSLEPIAKFCGQIRGNLAVRGSPPGHGEHFALEKFALRLSAPFEFEVFGFRQPLDWFRNRHGARESKFFSQESKNRGALSTPRISVRASSGRLQQL